MSTKFGFVRTTHDENGVYKTFDKAAHDYWQQGGAEVGHWLSDKPMTVEEIIEEQRKDTTNWPEGPLSATEVSIYLVGLLQYGLAGIALC